MSDPAARDAPSTVADCEAFTEARAGDDLYELIGSRIVMTTNPSEDHGQIVANLFAPLKAAMDAAGCRAYAGGVRVQPTEDRGGDMAAIPDIVVRCGPRRDRDFITDPLVVVEVLSRSTMVVDRGAKFDVYRGLPPLRHVVFVRQRHVRVEHCRRTADGWAMSDLVRPSDRLTLDAIDVSIGLDTVCFGVPALRPVDTSEDEGEGRF